jgi:hypothetical protein
LTLLDRGEELALAGGVGLLAPPLVHVRYTRLELTPAHSPPGIRGPAVVELQLGERVEEQQPRRLGAEAEGG